MQIDMHYYGTYAMARAAGLERETAQVIATSAQFVDDNIARDAVTFRDGSRIDTEATAHHPIDLSNRDDRDQRRVWVPFHFLPGNVGETYTERLKCRMDSPVVQEMCEHHLIHAERSFGPHLLGIATHVYADTFSHYGFSGVSSRGNRVENDSFRFHEDVDGMDGPVADLSSGIRDYITQKATAFFTGRGQHGGVLTNIKTWVAEEASGALGTVPSPPCPTGPISSGVSITNARTRLPEREACATTPPPFWPAAGRCTAFSGSSPTGGPTSLPAPAGTSTPSSPACGKSS